MKNLGKQSEIGLPGEEWPIVGALGGLCGKLREEVTAWEVYGEAAVILHHLAGTIENEGMREGF